jgi:hypothetical protein
MWRTLVEKEFEIRCRDGWKKLSFYWDGATRWIELQTWRRAETDF